MTDSFPFLVVTFIAILGFAAETSAALTTVSSRFGVPLSTTHTIGSAIMGVGATGRLSAVRWGVAQEIVMAWILRFPICFGLGWP